MNTKGNYMTDREAMQQALEALEAAERQLETDALVMQLNGANGNHQTQAAEKASLAILSLRERLAQPEDEPFAYAYTGVKNDGGYHGPHLVWKPEYMDAMSASKGVVAVPLYTRPQPASYDQGWKDGYKHGAWASEQKPADKPYRVEQDLYGEELKLYTRPQPNLRGKHD